MTFDLQISRPRSGRWYELAAGLATAHHYTPLGELGADVPEPKLQLRLGQRRSSSREEVRRRTARALDYLRGNEASAAALAKRYDLAPTTIYRYLEEWQRAGLVVVATPRDGSTPATWTATEVQR